MNYILYFAVAIILLFLVVKMLLCPIKILWKLIVNGILGTILLIVVNFFGEYLGFTIGINIWTALIAGFFGIPGVIFLIVFKFLL
ncbi:MULTISPECIES: pro-sigmaK processing inhibitor BofA family protein [Clostridium]|uniref:Sigma-K factor-processing regulatory protein BofA n=2 Tax=Clostridium TaxID=1485 RepID=A0A151AI59_9CLOT|nr:MULTISPECIES: pro-sigmaK processing inhibitor BofA family protein [Clostridium]KYH27313.1 sigma-K factor-processing regulatory protein BofA [Clostridium colicanis DSM 13634]MBE6044008.1 pro-sigmaK processing inhibitor BofA [Clostridium thermopalmarium]PRR73057.1 Sigma-K factor-processing regulatory protein BofA [Clostridium thermopalmarium DSM 5974]PVZ16540.1 inhibitor of the pro-sigma K processing machinery [Clostridium thermopalmarium DSM 5974]